MNVNIVHFNYRLSQVPISCYDNKRVLRNGEPVHVTILSSNETEAVVNRMCWISKLYVKNAQSIDLA